MKHWIRIKGLVLQRFVLLAHTMNNRFLWSAVASDRFIRWSGLDKASEKLLLFQSLLLWFCGKAQRLCFPLPPPIKHSSLYETPQLPLTSQHRSTQTTKQLNSSAGPRKRIFKERVHCITWINKIYANQARIYFSLCNMEPTFQALCKHENTFQNIILTLIFNAWLPL